MDERRGSPSLPLFLTVSFSLFIFSVNAGYAWQVLSLSPSHFPAPSFTQSLSLFSLFLFFYSSTSPFFSPSTFFLSVQVKVSRRKPPLLRLEAERERSEFTGKVWGDMFICFMAESLLIELITKLQPVGLA